MLILFPDWDLLISSLQGLRGKIMAPLQCLQDVIDLGERVGISDGVVVELTVVMQKQRMPSFFSAMRTAVAQGLDKGQDIPSLIICCTSLSCSNHTCGFCRWKEMCTWGYVFHVQLA